MKDIDQTLLAKIKDEVFNSSKTLSGGSGQSENDAGDATDSGNDVNEVPTSNVDSAAGGDKTEEINGD